MKLPTSSDYPLIIHGDCVEVLKGLPDACIDAVVTDPPYELGFMGKLWDASGIANSVELWAECHRVLKPGGHALIFGGTRTFHRMAVAVEDAGFEIRDSIAWLYGSGFPKSLNVSKAIDKTAGAEREVLGTSPNWRESKRDRERFGKMEVRGENAGLMTAPATDAAKQWDGWGTALKPAFEPIVVARKPLIGTVAANVLEHGTGALNVDGCRVGDSGGRTVHTRSAGVDRGQWSGKVVTGEVSEHGGRWPANVVLDEHTAAIVDEQSGVSVSTSGGVAGWQDKYVGGSYTPIPRQGHDDTGGASRFFYTAKAPGQERPSANGVAHPTVKPLDLMRWLIRLVTPPGGLVLEPFAGSGTTVEACIHEHMRCVAIEREADYLPLIDERINRNNLSLFAGGEA